MKLIRSLKSKNKGLKIAILGCVHGNENYSLKVFRKLKKISLVNGEVDFYLVNEKAFEKNKRFIESDLNRSFNQNLKTYEGKMSEEIKVKLKNYDFIIDMHSTTSVTNPFLITVSKKIIENNEMLESFGIKKCVYIPKGDYSLIGQFENAVSIEISIKNYKAAIKNGLKYITNFLKSKEMIEGKINLVQLEKYEGYGMCDKDNSFRDFKLSFRDGEYFYPMLGGETEHGHLKCFKLKKIN